jgi:hypothetical protein
LSSEIGNYYGATRRVNYEDCCYVVAQLSDAESGEFDNPAVQPLVDKLSHGTELYSLFQSGENRLRLFRESKCYIQDVVWQMLAKQPTRVDYLSWLLDAVRDRNVESTDFLTLNHDVVLEEALQKSGIGYCDGFGQPLEGIRFWEPSLLDENHRVRICKLHGSISWFWFPSKRRIGILLVPGRHDPSVRPEILVGTFNKMHQYTTSMFADLHCHFHRCLRQLESLICCGYGFGDKGINTKVAEWIEGCHSRRLAVVHPEPSRLLNSSRPAMATRWQQWREQGRLRLVQKKIEEVAWGEVRTALFA